MRRGEIFPKREPYQVGLVPVSLLRPDPRNARTHSKHQIRQIAASIREFGWTNPVLVDESNKVIAGHGRLAAAELLGLSEVPAIRLMDLTEAQRRALALADNKLAENAGWNLEALAQELKYLCEVEVDFEVEITGFSGAEIDLLIGQTDGSSDPKADRVPETPAAAETTVRIGDLWRLGRHRLLCGDATDRRDVIRLMDGQKARMVFTDPPYNVPVDGHVCGLGRVKHRDFAMASGEMSQSQFTTFLTEVLGHLVAHSADGSIHYICMDWRHLSELLTAGNRVYTELKNICVWNKSNAGMGSLYRSKHEMIVVFKTGRAPHINNIELGRNGRYRTNVWDYAGANSFGAGRLDELAMHPTVKPVAMVVDAMLDCSRRHDIVLDAFAGSGTALIAAERTSRAAYAMELDPAYVETSLLRWEAYTGERAVHAETGLGLSELRQLRSKPPAAVKPRIRVRSGSTRIEEAADGR